ncbi:endonuclease III [Sphaerochaeta sp. PS]|uniref:endonuclease III domain-containing protein n=1 Tax=Sphaerochaeta sp. PS TaxID=3076336 RepID=UPI0028A43DDF|nr:endonuclease III [Sphaerochaeta sp. PS]MDT4762776.1 endonuclease III [Sphaerochaeta sp. PS]
MNKLQKKAAAVYTILDELHPPHIQFLEQRDPFRFMISVILSAQTTDRIVNIVSGPLFERFPTVEALAAAPLEEVEEIIFPTGFYRMKAKNITSCAQALVGKEIPSTMEELIQLPGVGRKTASCVLGDIYGKPAIIVDTHFGRVVYRLGLVDTKDPEKIEKQIASLLEEKKQYRFSMTANMFGRTVCHAKKPGCKDCPLRPLCPSADAFLKASAKE